MEEDESAGLAEQQSPLLMADPRELEGELMKAAKELSMEREKREELGRFVQSACQLAEQPNLRDGFYTSPEEAHSKHHLDMGDIEHHHRSDEYAHAWHPLSPRRKTPHKGHGSAKSSKSKALKAAGAKGVHDAVSAPVLPLHAKGKESEPVVSDSTDHGDGVSHDGSHDAVGFYIGEGPNQSQANMGVKRGHAEEPPGGEEGKLKVTFHLGSQDGMHELEALPESSPVSGTEGGHRRHRHRHGASGSKDDVPYWQHIGSNVELDTITPVGQPDLDEDTALADGDIENITSHRFSNTWGARKRKLSYTHSAKMAKESPSVMSRDREKPKAQEMFVELDELVWDDMLGWEWKEKARWIKFEEDLEEGADRWGKPHVASLSFHSLLELRRCIEQGAMLLDLEATTMGEIAERVVDQLIITDQLDPVQRDVFMQALLSRHQHVGERPPAMTRNRTYLSLAGLDRLSQHKNSHDLRTNDLPKPSVPSSTEPPTKDQPTTVVNASTKDNVDSDEAKKVYVLPSGAMPYPSNYSARPDARILRKIPANAEATMVLAGNVDFLTKTVMAFVRLYKAKVLHEITEVALPVRFLFVVMGPTRSTIDCHEVGRSISTLMSDHYFLKDSYRAEDRQDLLDAINKFLDDSIVLPPCEWDKKTLLPILDQAKETLRRKQKRRRTSIIVTPPVLERDSLQRTGRLFGGMIQDMKRRYPFYWSDIKDGLNFHCFATFFFIYFACLSPAVTFGGLLSDKTDRWMGVSEMLVMTSLGGIFFSLVSAQPLIIVGATGPMLLFEESLYTICGQLGVEFLPMRLWVNLWVVVFTSLVVMLEGSFLVQYLTRFTEEIFSVLISLIFIYEVFYKLIKIFQRHPLLAYYPDPDLYPAPSNTSELELVVTVANVSREDALLLEANSRQPNTALLSIILTFGTFFIAEYLKKFRNSHFLGRSARRALGDFGVPIAIAIMMSLDYFIRDTYTEKLDVPKTLEPTDSHKRGWFINPMGIEETLPIWAIFAASVPALLLFILLFMEMQITSKIINKSERNLKKGSGYHLDLFLVGILVGMGGLFGLPVMTGAAVRSVSHVSALSVYSHQQAPGMKPVLSLVREQRVTAFAVHIMIGVSAMLGSVLRLVPLSVLFGVFLYMGVSSLAGIQLMDRMKLFFMPAKHHPMVQYIRRVPRRKIHMFTAIQVTLLIAMWAIKSSAASLAFPFALILTVPLRKYLLPLLFKPSELYELDSDAPQPQSQLDSDQDEPDFYEQVPIPV